MSMAHRPTWNPKQGQESKTGTASVSKYGLASHTKLKFRQVGQTSTSDVARRDLRAELREAERKALDKKRKAQGLPPLPPPKEEEVRGMIESGNAEEDEAAAKRRKILEEAAELDRDESSDEDEDEDEDEDDDDDDDSDSDSDDDTAALMAELAKIKKERAEEKARLEAEANAANQADRDAEIASGNPLLNLQAALGQNPDGSPSGGSGGGAGGGFAVKRRWDDDLIFKNQATTLEKPKKGEFVNDLLRSEFHKKFMQKYIK